MFVGYCLGSGIHWGGSIGLPPAELELALLFVYLACTLAADAAFLHLALIYPEATTTNRWRLVLYAPALAALIVAPAIGRLSSATVQEMIGAALVAGYGLSLAGALWFLVRVLRVDAQTRRDSGLVLIVSAVVAGGLVQILGAEGLLGGDPQAWNLTLGVIPGRHRHRHDEQNPTTRRGRCARYAIGGARSSGFRTRTARRRLEHDD